MPATIPPWKRLVFSLVTVLVPLAGFEGYCRWRESPPIYRPSAAAHYELVPGYRGRRDTVNSLGCRGPERPAERPAGTLRILASGASTTYGHILRDDETWPHFLERRYEAQGPPPVEVWNGGVSGYGLEQVVAVLEAGRLAALRPDVLVLYEGWNDPRLDNPAALEFEKKSGQSPRSDMLFRLASVRWIARKVQKRREDAELGAFRAAVTEETHRESVERQLEWLRACAPEAVSRTAALCRAHGVALAVVELPGLVQAPAPAAGAPLREAYDEALRRGIGEGIPLDALHAIQGRCRDETNAILRAAAGASGAVFLPLATRMAEKAGGGAGRPPDAAAWTPLFRDRLHFTPRGNQALAEAMQELLLEHGLLPRRT
jgi:lysophospholipase L1-like esterase